jgi:hypothetical protein
MTEPTDNTDWVTIHNPLQQPGWKPRHRADPMRPANPHTADPKLESFYEERIAEGRTGPNLTIGLILLTIVCMLLAVGVGVVVVWGLWLS